MQSRNPATNWLPQLLAGTVASITGTAASIGVVLAAFISLGATQEQTTSAVFVMLVCYGALSMLLSWRFRQPISIVWSTPGAALLVASASLVSQGQLSFNSVVGAFIVSGLLVTLTGLWPALGRLVGAIPKPIASAMLAGVIFAFCLAPFQAAMTWPAIVVPAVLIWLILFRIAPIWAAPAAMVVVFTLATISLGLAPSANNLLPTISLVVPQFELSAIVGIGVPLYLVTMASQNIPGLAIMKSFGYQVPFKSVMITTGLVSSAGAMFGGFNLNLAAITAALNANDQAHPDATKRWRASFLGGVEYIALAFVTPALVLLVQQTPHQLILTVAGLALVGTIANALGQALAEDRYRISAIVTFLIGASSVAYFNIGAAFWALCAGVLTEFWLKKKHA